jgi:hypothetical protein
MREVVEVEERTNVKQNMPLKMPETPRILLANEHVWEKKSVD